MYPTAPLGGQFVPPLPIATIEDIIVSDLVVDLIRYLEQKPRLVQENNSEGIELVMTLISQGKNRCAKYLLDTYKWMRNCKDKKGLTTLHYGALHCNRPMIGLLLEMGVNIVADNQGISPLHYPLFYDDSETLELFRPIAADSVYLAQVKKFLLAGQFNLLHLAARRSTACLSVILQFARPDVSMPDAQGLTPLHHAALGKHAELNCTLLLRAEAQVNLVDSLGRTVLSIACCKGLTTVINQLLEHGVNASLGVPQPLSFTYLSGQTELALKLVSMGHATAKVRVGKYSLYEIVKSIGDEAFAKILRASGVELTPAALALDNEPQVPSKRVGKFTEEALARGEHLRLYDGANNFSHNSFLHELMLDDTVDFDLLDKYTPKEHWLKLTNGHEETPFLYCCRKGPVRNVIELLKRKHADSKMRDREGNSAHQIALQHQNLLVFFLLLREWPELVNAQNKAQETLLHQICLQSSVPQEQVVCIIERIVARKGNLEISTTHKRTPFLFAWSKLHRIALYCFIRLGAKLDAQDDESRTVLLGACQNRESQLVKDLLTAGASADVICRNTTALLEAIKAVDLGAVEILFERQRKAASVNVGFDHNTPLTASIMQIVQKIKGKTVSDEEIEETVEYKIFLRVLNQRPRLDQEVSLPNKLASTALTIAAEENLVPVTRELLKRGAEVDYRPKGKWKALRIACVHGFVGIATELLQAGASMSANLKKDTATRLDIQALFQQVSERRKTVAALPRNSSMPSLQRFIRHNSSGNDLSSLSSDSGSPDSTSSSPRSFIGTPKATSSPRNYPSDKKKLISSDEIIAKLQALSLDVGLESAE